MSPFASFALSMELLTKLFRFLPKDALKFYPVLAYGTKDPVFDKDYN